jgi:hypothetical protein
MEQRITIGSVLVFLLVLSVGFRRAIAKPGANDHDLKNTIAEERT